MLTERERKWLEDREWFIKNYDCLYYWCNECPKFNRYNHCTLAVCPVDGLLGVNFRDVAEFEARVARKLAEKIPLAMRMAQIEHNDFVMDAEIALKLVRLDVEKEMEAEQC